MEKIYRNEGSQDLKPSNTYGNLTCSVKIDLEIIRKEIFI